MTDKPDPDTDDTLHRLIERLEQALIQSENLCRLIQARVDPEAKKQWENLNTILYAAHAAVSAERTARST